MYIEVHRPNTSPTRARRSRQRPVAIGEIGPDLFATRLSDAGVLCVDKLEDRARIRPAGAAALPPRQRSVVETPAQDRVRGGIAHAFNGSPQQADEFIKLGFKLGFGGAFTWPRANNLRRLAVDLPLGAIVLETDSPDIPPVWIGRGRNAPGELPRIAQTLAELRGLDIDAVADATTRNARELFSLA
jgi:TatD DNase family protein